MNKISQADFVDAIASKAGLSKSDAENFYNAHNEVLISNLVSGNEIQTNIGKWTISDSAARVGRNPQTGEPINIPAKRVPKFRAGKKLKDAVQS